MKRAWNWTRWTFFGYGENPDHFMRDRPTAVAMERKLTFYYGIPGQDSHTIANLLQTVDSIHYFDTSQDQRWRFFVEDGELLGAQIAPVTDDGGNELFPYGLDPLVEMGVKRPPMDGNDSVGLFQQIPSTWQTAGPEVDTVIMWDDIVLPLVPEPTPNQLDEWDAMLQNMGIDPSIMKTYDYEHDRNLKFIDSINKVAGDLANELNKYVLDNFAANGEVLGDNDIPVYTAPWVPENTVVFGNFKGIAGAYRELDEVVGYPTAGSETADAEHVHFHIRDEQAAPHLPNETIGEYVKRTADDSEPNYTLLEETRRELEGLHRSCGFFGGDEQYCDRCGVDTKYHLHSGRWENPTETPGGSIAPPVSYDGKTGERLDMIVTDKAGNRMHGLEAVMRTHRGDYSGLPDDEATDAETYADVYPQRPVTGGTKLKPVPMGDHSKPGAKAWRWVPESEYAEAMAEHDAWIKARAWSEIGVVVDTYYEALNPKYVGKTVLVNRDPIPAKNGVYKMELPKPRRVSEEVEMTGKQFLASTDWHNSQPEIDKAAATMRAYWADFPDAKYDLPKPDSFVKMSAAEKHAQAVSDHRKFLTHDWALDDPRWLDIPGDPIEGTDMADENPRTEAQIIRDIQGSERKRPKHAAKGKTPRPGETRVRIDSAGTNHLLDRG